MKLPFIHKGNTGEPAGVITDVPRPKYNIGDVVYMLHPAMRAIVECIVEGVEVVVTKEYVLDKGNFSHYAYKVTRNVKGGYSTTNEPEDKLFTSVDALCTDVLGRLKSNVYYLNETK